jgi:hypothetical protein
MEKLRHIAKPVAHLVLFGFLSLTLHLPAAQAGLIGTETVVGAQQTEQNRERVRDMLNRDEVKRELLARGVNPGNVQARVDSLTDEEVQFLASKMDQLPAGGDALGVLVFIFIVLLITDILGFTDIFPFVKKPAKR